MQENHFILLFTLCTLTLSAQCPDREHGVIWAGNDPLISMDELAHYAAPMLWFSPDEEHLRDDNGELILPNTFPYEPSAHRVVYYKYKTVYTVNKETVFSKVSAHKAFDILDLRQVKAVSLEYYNYFASETGLGSHPHDIESSAFQLEVNTHPECTEYKYSIRVIRVIGRAHGIRWFDHVLDVDAQTFLPLSILVEEGKHASITDKNADGVYTPTYDVSKRVNDAWGARDIISTGKLVNGGFQAWMAKTRKPEDIVFPPTPRDHQRYVKYMDKFEDYISPQSTYQLRPYPDYPREGLDKILNKKMKEKKYHDWPEIKSVKHDANVNQWRKEDYAFRSLSVAYRWDDSDGLTLIAPLLLFKTVEAPMTGGWLVNKFSFGLGETSISDTSFVFEKAIGHQILYTSSASKWLDTYVALGYDLLDIDIRPDFEDYDTFFVSEVGIKVRLNISKTPLSFLKYLGTEYWGIRIGWKNTGFHPFVNSGFILEVGAGIF